MAGSVRLTMESMAIIGIMRVTSGICDTDRLRGVIVWRTVMEVVMELLLLLML